jgi:hypothetical protein
MHETSPMPKDIPHVPQLELLCANTNMLTALTAPVEVYLLLYVLSPPLVVLVLLMRPRQEKSKNQYLQRNHLLLPNTLSLPSALVKDCRYLSLYILECPHLII